MSATVPAEGRDFRGPTVTSVSDGEWRFSTENTEALANEIYHVYRSRQPINIMEDFSTAGYEYDSVYDGLNTYRIPEEKRNGVWYIVVGHTGPNSSSTWSPTFFTYGV